jgi:hypothetical protein
VSQPCDRSACITAPGKVDQSLGEFWVENPWQIVAQGRNLSAFERDRTWLNFGGKAFLDVSFLGGMDNDGDGRCVVAGDFRNNGRMEVLVQQSGGGALLLFENNFPQRNYLRVSLRGRRSNRLGIGARLTALVGGQQLVRELYPLNSFRSQMPSEVHFGLADADKVDRLTIRWPSGKTQVLTDLRANAHIVIDEGKDGAAAVETIVPGRTYAP